MKDWPGHINYPFWEWFVKKKGEKERKTKTRKKKKSKSSKENHKFLPNISNNISFNKRKGLPAPGQEGLGQAKEILDAALRSDSKVIKSLLVKDTVCKET